MHVQKTLHFALFWLAISILILSILYVPLSMNFLYFKTILRKFSILKKNLPSICKISNIIDKTSSNKPGFCKKYSNISNIFNQSTVEDFGISEQYTKPTWTIEPTPCLCNEFDMNTIAILGIIGHWTEFQRRDQV